MRKRVCKAFVRGSLALAALLAAPPALAAEEDEDEELAEEIVVSAQRLPPALGQQPFAAETVSFEELTSAPTTRLDEILKEAPGFTLFRRASSFSAHPTAQGTSLKAINPNGASRALVVKDGIPLNDPFGGWVYWAALDPFGIDHVRITTGAGAGAWGSGVLTGAVEIVSRVADSGYEAELAAGSLSTFEGSQRVTIRDGHAFAVLSGGAFATDGFFLVPESQRGPVDVPVASSFSRAGGLVGREIGGGVTASVHFSYFGEERVNGLDLATNSTRAFDAGARLIKDSAAGVSWEANLYGRTRDFASTFASVNDERTSATQVLDQFDVPAREIGANGRARFTVAALEVEAGTDLRLIRGFTNEHFRNLGQGFTRLRTAGGEQRLLGFWVEAATEAAPRLTLSGRVRVDAWRISDGVIREESLEQPGLVLRDDEIVNRAGVAPSGRLGARYRASEAVALFAAAYTGFRLPTLNELFRPFRVGNDITEANPNLDPERIYGLEGGVEVSRGSSFSGSLAFFRDWMVDGVGNVTIAEGPGNFPPAGFVPEGGTLRQRANIARIGLTGLRARAVWHPTNQVEIEGGYIYQRSRIASFPDMPELIGNRVILSPRHTATLSAIVYPHRDITLAAHLRLESRSFEDDRNTRALDSVLTADFTASYQLGRRGRITAALINAFDEQVASAIAADGLLTLTNPRRVLIRFEAGF